MEPSKIRFGGSVSQSVVHPVILIVVLIAGLVICFGSRNKALVAFLSAALLIPVDQILLIGSLHFPMLRVLIIFGLARLVREKFSGTRLLGAGWNRIDWAMLVLTVFSFVDGILLYPESASVVYQLGALYSAFGAYFLIRFLIRQEDDVVSVFRTLAYIAMVVAVLMSYEQLTGKNPYYASLGGAHAAVYGSAMEREDHFRATGCFGHPNLAGTFGGICLPLFVGLWWRTRSRKDRAVSILGMLASVIIAVTASSSTALMSFAAGILALIFWPFRKWMRPIRWAVGFALVGLHVIMKAPVWHLISRVDLAGGSSSYHRYQLIDQCILHFKDWWLIGTKAYADWGWDLWDLSNQYVATADTAGLIPLLAFVAMIVFSFQYLGKARKLAAGDRRRELFIWALGACLFANMIAFLGIAYFDQMIVAWYVVVAMIPIAARSAGQAARVRKEPKLHPDAEVIVVEDPQPRYIVAF